MDAILSGLTNAATSVATMFVNLFSSLGGIFVTESGDANVLTIVGAVLIISAVLGLATWGITKLVGLFRIRRG